MSHQPRRMLVTGGCGFIGSNYIRRVLETHRDAQIVNLDALTYAGNRESLSDVEARFSERYRFVEGSITDAAVVRDAIAGCDTVVNFAAESHVDRSIDGPAEFLQTNIMGTYVLLEAARGAWGDRDDVRFHQVSTDEVFGSFGGRGVFRRGHGLRPEQSLQRQQGERRPSGSRVAPHLWCAGDPVQLLQQLRSVPVPREADPAHDPEVPAR